MTIAFGELIEPLISPFGLATPFSSFLIGATCVDPAVSSVVNLDATGTLWRVTFAQAMRNNPPLGWIGSYRIFELDAQGIEVPGGHSPAVLSLSLQVASAPLYVDLRTEEHNLSLNYGLEIHRVEVD